MVKMMTMMVHHAYPCIFRSLLCSMWPLLPALSHPILPYPILSHLPWHCVVSCRFMSYSVMSCHVPPFGRAFVPVAVDGTQNTYLIAMYLTLSCATFTVLPRRLSEREEELSTRNQALSVREEAAKRATEEAQGVRNEIERCVARLYVLSVCNTPLFQL